MAAAITAVILSAPAFVPARWREITALTQGGVLPVLAT